MVHVTGNMTAVKGQRDKDLGVTPPEKCVVLKRTVEILQWVERETKEDDKTEWHYEREWREEEVDSSKFKYKEGHRNHKRKYPFYSKKFTSDTVNLQAFELKRNVLEKLDEYKPLSDNLWQCNHTHKDFDVCASGGKKGTVSLTAESITAAAATPRKFFDKIGARNYSISGQGQHLVSRSGCMRISYQVVNEGPVSICGVQTENTFRRFRFDRDGSVPCCTCLSPRAHGMYDVVADEEPPPPLICCPCTDYILKLVGKAFPHTVLLLPLLQ